MTKRKRYLCCIVALLIVTCSIICYFKYKAESIDTRMIRAIDAQLDGRLSLGEICRLRLGDVYDCFFWDTAVIFEGPYDEKLYPSLGIEEKYFDNGIAFYLRGKLVRIFYTYYNYDKDMESVISFQVNRYYTEEPYTHHVQLTPDSFVYARKEKRRSGPTVFDEFWRYIVSAY
ncbi:MAG: hypothetical protein IKE04_01015 [Oscillospiraceae bacterium]|nr:hypothetical protein [Oscillospiraceae bacterium]MBR6953483.1 hypothetical protein [Clostridia bacterium]